MIQCRGWDTCRLVNQCFGNSQKTKEQREQKKKNGEGHESEVKTGQDLVTYIGGRKK